MALSDEHWNRYIEGLHAGSCCLIIGPSIPCLRNDEGRAVTISERFAAFLESEMRPHTISAEAGNDFYYNAGHYKQKVRKGDAEAFNADIRRFNKVYLNEVPLLFKQLAKLPFKSICNLSPDSFMVQALADGGRHYEEDHYDFSTNMYLAKEAVDDDVQFVYYLYGHYMHPNSVPVDSMDQLKMIKGIVSGIPKIPEYIVRRFNQPGKSFLFLGFDFNDWHYRLTIDSMGILKPVASYFPSSPYDNIAFITRAHYETNYGIEFLNVEADQFVGTLLEKYTKAYGDPDRLIRIVLDYDNVDTVYFNTLLGHLKTACTNRNFSFLHKGDIELGSRKTIDDLLRTADVYIPFICQDFLNPAAVSRLKAACHNSKLKTIIINSDYANYTNLLGPLDDQVVILPRHQKVLSDALADKKLPQLCAKLANTINAIIK